MGSLLWHGIGKLTGEYNKCNIIRSWLSKVVLWCPQYLVFALTQPRQSPPPLPVILINFSAILQSFIITARQGKVMRRPAKLFKKSMFRQESNFCTNGKNSIFIFHFTVTFFSPIYVTKPRVRSEIYFIHIFPNESFLLKRH